MPFLISDTCSPHLLCLLTIPFSSLLPCPPPQYWLPVHCFTSHDSPSLLLPPLSLVLFHNLDPLSTISKVIILHVLTASEVNKVHQGCLLYCIYRSCPPVRTEVPLEGIPHCRVLCLNYVVVVFVIYPGSKC